MRVLAAAEGQEEPPITATTSPAEGRRLGRLRDDVPFLVLLAATFVLCLLLLRPGHDWGDDFALYINQARSLVHGDVQHVYHQNQVTVNESAWQSFSPYTYGWGFPLLLAPLYAVFGLSYLAFKSLEIALYLGFLTAFYVLIRNRIDRLAALLILAALVLDNLYTAWTNTVLTEFPFMFFSVLSLVVIEALHAPQRLTSMLGSRRYVVELAGLGVLIGFTLNIRNEGAVLLAALAARQLAVVMAHRQAWNGTWRQRVPVLAVPWATAVLVGAGIRLVLPTDQGQSLTLAGGLGGHNWSTNDGFYRQGLAELLALKDRVHGTALLALLVFLIVLALGGMVLGGWRDLPLSVFAGGLAFVYLDLPYREGRYLMVVLPFLLYFALQGLRGTDIRSWGIQPRHLLLLMVVGRHALGMANAADYWRTYPRAIDGPDTPRGAADVRRDRRPRPPRPARGLLPAPSHEPVHPRHRHHRRLLAPGPPRTGGLVRHGEGQRLRPVRALRRRGCGHRPAHQGVGQRGLGAVAGRPNRRLGPSDRQLGRGSMRAVTKALDDLVDLLDLEPIEVNIFRGVSPDESRQRVFGGQVAGQALVAAARTVGDPGRPVHSLHAYFLRPGDPTVPILYNVDRIRDGKSFTTRRVVAIQHGRVIFNLQASFHRPEPGLNHQIAMDTSVPSPRDLPDFASRMEPYRDQLGEWLERSRPIDTRYVGLMPAERRGPQQPSQRVWLRADGTLPDDPVLHACIVTYASDMTLLDTTLLPHGVTGWTEERLQMASLDHAMWFHRPFRADEWLLYDQSSPSTSDARGLAMGQIFTEDGRLAVTVVQEGLIRVVR